MPRRVLANVARPRETRYDGCMKTFRLLLAIVPALAAGAALAAESPAVSTAGWSTYKGNGYTILYPPHFTVDTHHSYDALGKGRSIVGTSFTVPGSISQGTNLSPDSYLSVEVFPFITCTPHAYLSSPEDQKPVTDGTRTWLVATDDEGAAGSVYEETVYALQGSTPCIGVRYFVHSANIGNFDPGAVRAFDEGKLTALFDAMRTSLKVTAPPGASP